MGKKFKSDTTFMVPCSYIGNQTVFTCHYYLWFPFYNQSCIENACRTI